MAIGGIVGAVSSYKVAKRQKAEGAVSHIWKQTNWVWLILLPNVVLWTILGLYTLVVSIFEWPANREESEFNHIRDCNAGPAEYYDYDNLSRITDANYFVVTDPNLTDYETEAFTMHDLGNRDSVTLRGGGSDDYVIDNTTNRYGGIDGTNLEYYDAGNLITDKDGYQYKYDYENRIVEILNDSSTPKAQFAYDALGRRVRKKDFAATRTTLYCYPRFAKYFVTNEQYFDSITLGETIQATFSVLIGRTQWVKAKRML